MRIGLEGWGAVKEDRDRRVIPFMSIVMRLCSLHFNYNEVSRKKTSGNVTTPLASTALSRTRLKVRRVQVHAPLSSGSRGEILIAVISEPALAKARYC